MAHFEDLLGMTLTKIEGCPGNEELRLYTSDGRAFMMWHDQD